MSPPTTDLQEPLAVRLPQPLPPAAKPLLIVVGAFALLYLALANLETWIRDRLRWRRFPTL